MNDETNDHRIRVVLFDELGLFRAGLGRLLASDPRLEVAGECGAAAEALHVLKQSTVDLVLLDFERTERLDDFMAAARQSGYQGRFLIVTGALDLRKAAMALTVGASGIFLKSEPPERLIQAIKFIVDGEVWLDPKVIQLLAEWIGQHQLGQGQPPGRPLDGREQKVLIGIVGGLSNRRIGEKIGISEGSVKNVVRRLFGKAGVKTRSQLVRVALEGSWGAAREFAKRPLSDSLIAARPPSRDPSRTSAAHIPAARHSHD